MKVAVQTKEEEVANASTSTNRAKAEAAEAEKSIETRAAVEVERALKLIQEQEAAKKVIEAEGDRKVVVMAAEADKEAEIARAEGARDADVARGQGAEALLVLGRAEAERDRLKNEAYIVEQEANLLNDDTVVKYLLAKNAPELAKILPPAIEAAFKPLECIEGMRILQVNTDGGGGAGDSPLSDVMRNLVKNAPAIPILNELLQFGDSKTTVQEVVEKVVGGAVSLVGDMSTDTSEVDA